MMATQRKDRDWLAELPPLRGRLARNAPLSTITWFRVGGPAELMFRPADLEELQGFLAAKPAEVPVTVIGVGSNLLVRDGGVPGVVIRLGRGFAEIRAEGERIRAGAAALDLNVAFAARDTGLAGLEFLSGIPGTIGGALRMNGGAYGREMTDVLVEGEAVDGEGRLRRLSHGDFGFAYRHSSVPEDWIFLWARLAGQPDEPAAIGRRMVEIQSAREASQPVRTRTGGSTFANPRDPKAKGTKAWQLIEAAGCRGLRLGGAQVSEQHCNFLINTGGATAADIENLGEEVCARVKAHSGVELEWEIKRLGER